MPAKTRRARREARRILEKAARTFELPEEVVLGLPKVTLIGRVQVLIENHRGLKEYAPGSLRVRTAQGTLAVSGKRLAIASIGTDEIVLEGDIECVRFEEGRGGGE